MPNPPLQRFTDQTAMLARGAYAVAVINGAGLEGPRSPEGRAMSAK